MNTLEFFRAVLPEDGFYFLVTPTPKGAWKHHAFSSLEEMADAALQFDQGTTQVYHACASYCAPSTDVGGKVQFRVNQKLVKSFWIDIDCGEEKAAAGLGYATKTDAGKAVLRFCKDHEFPVPMIVSSGNGVHCYWPLTKSIEADKWLAVASQFKKVLASAGMLADRSRTSDLASILRPVGTTNRKGEPKPVKLLRDGSPIRPSEFAAAVSRLVKTFGGSGEELAVPSYAMAVDLNSDLTAHQHVDIPSSVVEVANKCAQVALMRDTQGDVGYEHWRGVIGLIKLCVEDDSLAHEWSARRAETGHAQTDVQARLDTWNARATTCDFFEQHNPGGCDGCPYKGKLTSPIQLGRVMPEAETESHVEELEVGDSTVELEVPPLPPGYEWRGGRMLRYLKDKDGNLQPFAFSPTRFYITHLIRKEDDRMSFMVRRHHPRSGVRDFVVGSHNVPRSTDLMSEFASYNVHPSNNKDATMHMTAYIRDYIAKLEREAEELSTMSTFGWRDDMDGFVLGDRLYHRDGSVRKVLLGGNAAVKLDAFPDPVGTVKGYVDAVNFVYGSPDMLPMRYAFLNAFGSVVTPLGDPAFSGAMFAIVGGESGKGKTTVCKAAMYAFGDASKLVVDQLHGATANGLLTTMETLKNLPVIFDELTKVPSDKLSSLAYSLATGQGKIRTKVTRNDGVVLAKQQTWRSSTYVTGNADLISRLAEAQANSQAEAVRIIQINIDRYNIPKFEPPSQVKSALEQMERNMGVVGDQFVRYVVTHMDEISGDIRAELGALEKHLVDPKYRFYISNAACNLAAAKILSKLDILHVDLDELRQFAIELLTYLSGRVVSTNTLAGEGALYEMVTALSPRILNTVEYRDGRDRRGPEQFKPFQSPIAGRYVAGNPNATPPDPLSGKLYLSHKDVSEWCGKNRIEFSSLVEAARDEGVLVNENERFNLTRGTGLVAAQKYCLVLDAAKMEASGKPKLVVHSNEDVDAGLQEAV